MTVPATTSASTTDVSHQLATELAAGLTPLPEILKRFSLTPAKLKQLVADPHFQLLYAEAKAVWHGDANVRERVRAKAQALVEDSLLPVYGIIHNPDMAPATRLDGFSKLAKIADLEPRRDNDAGGGSSFQLTINIPGEKEVTITHEEGAVDGRDTG
jgi:hypothetical protein